MLPTSVSPRPERYSFNKLWDYIRKEEDVEPIVDLFRLNYGRPWLDRKSDPDEKKDISIPEVS